MRGIDLNKPIAYQYASMRYFSTGERHITRFCKHDVLLMVFDGVLRFSEDGTEYEVHAGEYHIQKNNTYQSGYAVSDSPKYLFVHFHADWCEDGAMLPFSGTFDSVRLKDRMEEIDRLSHANAPLISKTAKFLALLELLIQRNSVPTLADQIAQYIKSANKRQLSRRIQSIFTKNSSLNALVGFYYEQALSLNIRCDWQVRLPEKLNIEDIDLFSIIGNLLENAIHAAKEEKVDNRYVNFKADTEENDDIYIVVTNGFSGKIRKEKDKYLSTKKDGSGIGIESIKTAASKYQGFVSFYHDTNTFYADVMLKQNNI